MLHIVIARYVRAAWLPAKVFGAAARAGTTASNSKFRLAMKDFYG
jgi:hypothetical protein